MTRVNPDKRVCMQNKRVLLAEDNLINQAVARKMLTSLGMSCDVANNGQLAVEKVLTDPAFDIILMDMSMPVMGGVEATQVCTSAFWLLFLQKPPVLHPSLPATCCVAADAAPCCGLPACVSLVHVQPAM